MNSVRVEKGRFVIDGEETFLFGGELHYFRVRREEWEQRLEMIARAGCNLVSTYVPWVWHEREEGDIDLTGRTRGERDLKAFLELVKEKGLYCFVRPGPYVMAEIRLEGVPPWLVERYPEIVAKRADGTEHPTRVVSYRHPFFLEKVRRWYREVNRVIAPMQRTHGGPVILYQLCNEVGMLHWVSNTSDFNDVTLAEFERHLKEKYGTVDALNKKHGTDADSFFQWIESFRNGSDKGSLSLHYEWRRFWRRYFRQYIDQLKHFAEEDGIEVPFVVNVHGFKDYSIYSRGVDYPIGLSQLCEVASIEDTVMAGDFYPGHVGYDNFHDLVLASVYTQAVSRKEQPLFSAEFQSGRLSDRPRLYPQDLDLITRTCIAHGMKALNYYMFTAGENYEDIGIFGRRHEWQAPVDSKGRPRPQYETARHLGRMLQAVGKRLTGAQKVVHTHVGFNPDDYLTDVVEPRFRSRMDELSFKREHFAFDGILRLLSAANISFDAVNLLKPFSAEEVPTLWVFSTSCMDPDLQERLARYVQEGGKLVLYPEIPTRDLEGKPCRILADRLELGTWEVIPGNDVVDVLGIESVAVKQRLRFERYEGEPIALYTRQNRRETAAYHKQAGNGEILVLGIAMGQDFDYQLDVIRAVAERIGVRPHLSADVPHLSVVERRNGSESFLFVLNYTEWEQETNLYEGGRPLFDGEKIVLPPRSGAMYLRNFPVAEGLLIEYATVEMTHWESAEGRVDLTVRPVGRSGMLKIRMGGGWRANIETSPEKGLLRIGPIDKPVTLTFWRETDT